MNLHWICNLRRQFSVMKTVCAILQIIDTFFVWYMYLFFLISYGKGVMSKLHMTSEYRWNVKILRIVFRNSIIRVHCSDTFILTLLCQIEIGKLVWVYVSVMTVYEHCIWFECMYQLWLYMNIEFGVSVCISYGCIWALNLVWVYVAVMTVYEHWIWFECMYQLWLYMNIEFGTLVQGYRRGLRFGFSWQIIPRFY